MFMDIHYLLPIRDSEWADQSNPVLCIYMACCITTITAIYCAALYGLALCVNAVDFEKKIYFSNLCPTQPLFILFYRLLPNALVMGRNSAKVMNSLKFHSKHVLLQFIGKKN